MAYKNYYDTENPRNGNLNNMEVEQGDSDWTSQREPTDQPETPPNQPPTAPPPPPNQPAAPRISSHWGASDPRGVEDMWFQFLNSSGLTQGGAGLGAYKGGGAYRGNLGDIVNRFNEATGLNARVAGEDMIDFGYGKQDVIKAGSNDWWLGARGGVEPPTISGPVNTGPARPVPTPAPQSGGGGVGAPAGVSQELYDLLLGRARQGTTINRNDPNIRQQVDPYTAQVDRQRRNYISDMAERAGPLGNIQGEQRMAAERAGQASGLFESQLIGRELQSRRDEITHALDSLGNRLTEDQRLALQRELATLEDATRRYGIDAQSRIAEGQLGTERDRIGLGYSDLDWRMDPRNPANFGND